MFVSSAYDYFNSKFYWQNKICSDIDIDLQLLRLIWNLNAPSHNSKLIHSTFEKREAKTRDRLRIRVARRFRLMTHVAVANQSIPVVWPRPALARRLHEIGRFWRKNNQEACSFFRPGDFVPETRAAFRPKRLTHVSCTFTVARADQRRFTRLRKLVTLIKIATSITRCIWQLHVDDVTCVQ